MTSLLKLDDVGKRYLKYEDVPLLLTRLRFRARTNRTDLWALKHVNLDAEAGENIGVIGRNGSGKSTMLRILAGVTAPTEGVVTVHGRVAPLISVGVGFHQELTGRENVFVNGMILGLSRRELDRRFDQIVEFAELESFIDTPVKFYSSGMFMRLGFSVAVASRPDVLLVDEVLAVGDITFQAKCFERMAQMKEDGTTIVLVSHNINAIRRTCARVLVLHDGIPKFFGPTDEAISIYHQLVESPGDEVLGDEGSDSAKEIVDFSLLDAGGANTNHVNSGEDMTFRYDARFSRPMKDPIFMIRITTETGQLAYSTSTYGRPSGAFDAWEPMRCDVRLNCKLATGSYRAMVWIRAIDEEWRSRQRVVEFFVSGRHLVQGVADLDASIEISSPGSGAVETEATR
jgi:ABC-type polysaccharide/polyol phosphate transport system ATPase subunit